LTTTAGGSTKRCGMSRAESWMRRAEFVIVAAVVVLIAIAWLYSIVTGS